MMLQGLKEDKMHPSDIVILHKENMLLALFLLLNFFTSSCVKLSINVFCS